jgi:lysyl-tRNA synthetase class II
MELYVAYKDYLWMMETTESLLERVAIESNGKSKIQVGDNEIEFKAPYPRIPIFSAIETHTGIDVSNIPLSDYRKKPFYIYRSDALDRFGTRLEQRFSYNQIKEMMVKSGLERIKFSNKEPFWCAVGYRK